MRQFAIYDKQHHEREFPLSTKAVLSTVPDLSESEVESIVNLNVSESIEIDNTIIIRTQ